MVTIGIYAQSDPARLSATLASVGRHAANARLVLLPDAPDAALAAAIAARPNDLLLPSARPSGEPAAFNRLVGHDDAPVVIFLEAGVVVTAGWLDRLLAALAEPGVGLAGPSTNFAWNAQGLRGAPGFGAGAGDIDAFAAHLAAHYRDQVVPLGPLYSLGDFCFAVRRDVIEAIGGADEGFGVGPCWEMEYHARAARAGFAGVWVKGAYVQRAPHTARRSRDETLWFAASRRRYQDSLCGLRLRGEKQEYEPHCRGDDCPYFAPRALIQLHRPLQPPSTGELLAGASAEQAVVPGTPEAARAAPAAPAVSVQPALEAALPAPSEEPLVSCIMPTCNRRAFLPRALRAFLRQDYANRELIVVDDGSDPVPDCLPTSPRVRYLRLNAKRTIGAKRNLACAEARGELILHWDDDDWYPPWRVRAQVRALLSSAAQVCGSSRLYYVDPAAHRAWRYEYSGAATWVAGNTLAYRKCYWARHPFPDVQVGEDARFIWSGQPGELLDLKEVALCVGTIHAGNTSPKGTTGAYWHALPSAQMNALLGEEACAVPSPDAISPLSEEQSADWPLITCIMPTSNRREFLPLALRCFQAQEYPAKELVIVDDGADPVGDLAAGAPDVRYVHLPTRASIGAKRNLACAQARGTLIAHWDDDDWYAPGRLRYQAAPIVTGQADLTGLENRYVLQLPGGEYWTATDVLHQRMFVGDVHGGTIVYRRSIFDGGVRYPDVNLAEDAALIRQALQRGTRLARLANPGLFVYVRHGRNAWQFETGRFLDPSGWRRIDPPVTVPAGLLDWYRSAAAFPASRVGARPAC